MRSSALHHRSQALYVHSKQVQTLHDPALHQHGRCHSTSATYLELPSDDPDAQQRRLDQEDRLIAMALLVCFVVQALVLWL